MRVSLPVLLLLLCGALCGSLCHRALAQEQERKLIDRIMKPDETVSFGAQKKDFFNAKSFKADSAHVNDFYMPQKFKAKDYLTGAYSGQKGFWKGDFKYGTAEADTKGKGMTPRIVKGYDTKAMPVKADRDATKNYGTGTYATDTSKVRGKSQDKIDIEGPQALNTIQDGSFTELKTIDDIRNLLNKNK